MNLAPTAQVFIQNPINKQIYAAYGTTPQPLPGLKGL